VLLVEVVLLEEIQVLVHIFMDMLAEEEVVEDQSKQVAVAVAVEQLVLEQLPQMMPRQNLAVLLL